MEKLIMYTSITCPKCEVLKKKLKAKDIDFIEINSLKELKSKGIKSVPVLQSGNDKMNYTEAIKFVNLI